MGMGKAHRNIDIEEDSSFRENHDNDNHGLLKDFDEKSVESITAKDVISDDKKISKTAQEFQVNTMNKDSFHEEDFPRDNGREPLHLAPTYQGDGGRSDAFIRMRSRDKDIRNKSRNYDDDDTYSNRNRRWSDEDNRRRRITYGDRDHRRSRSRSRDRGRNTPRRRDYY